MRVEPRRGRRGDDVRDPQDVDDAALAAAVYLCFGSHDLPSQDGRRAAVHRYNPDDGYGDLVLRIAENYADPLRNGNAEHIGYRRSNPVTGCDGGRGGSDLTGLDLSPV